MYQLLLPAWLNMYYITLSISFLFTESYYLMYQLLLLVWLNMYYSTLSISFLFTERYCF